MQSAFPALPSITEPHSASLELPRWHPFPLTLRGALLAAVLLYALLGPARLEADIVAATLGFTAGALFLALLIVTVVSAINLRRSVRLELAHLAEQYEAGRETTLVLKLSRFSVLPGFVLTVQPYFNSPALAVPEFRLTGRSGASRYLSCLATFPHRGIWSLRELRVGFGDQLGLTQLRWQLLSQTEQLRYTVNPPACAIGQAPIISSFERPGDMVSQSQERLGDPLEIKRYEASDGARRIVWKIFARRGELVSRHPEASMSPEGRVVMFAPALAQEDPVCSAMLRYAEQLTELNLELVAGCSGMGSAVLARSPEALRALLVNSVWSSDQDPAHTQSELSTMLQRLAATSSGERLQRVALFTSARRFRTASDRDLMLGLCATLRESSITPIVFVVDSAPGTAAGAELGGGSSTGLHQMLRRWFTDLPRGELQSSAAEYQEFLSRCARQQIEVVFIRTQ